MARFLKAYSGVLKKCLRLQVLKGNQGIGNTLKLAKPGREDD
jgi:hypothetical protein